MAPPAPRRAPYKDFLQPALQRRLASTAGVALALSYVEALTLCSWDSRMSFRFFLPSHPVAP